MKLNEPNDAKELPRGELALAKGINFSRPGNSLKKRPPMPPQLSDRKAIDAAEFLGVGEASMEKAMDFSCQAELIVRAIDQGFTLAFLGGRRIEPGQMTWKLDACSCA